MTQMPMSGMIITARPRPIAAGSPEVMNANRDSAEQKEIETSATHMKPMSS